MKNRLIRLLFIPSGMALMISLSKAEKYELVLFSLIGLALGALFCFSRIDRRFPANRAECIFGMAAAVFLCTLTSKHLFNTWARSTIMASLLGRIFPNYSTGLTVLCAIAGLAAFPVLAYMMTQTVAWLVRAFGLLNIRKILHTLKEKVSRSVILKKAAVVVINVVAAAMAGTLLLMAVYSLPVDAIDAHVRSSAATIQKEGTYPQLYSWCQSQLDNWTDSIMLLEAADATEASVPEKAMNAYRGSLAGYNPAQSLIGRYVQDAEFTETVSYARYWHGYLIAVKPLLTFFDYNTIRILNGVLQLGTLLFVCILMSRKELKPFIVPYLLCYLMLMPVAMAKCLQFSACYYVFTAGVIALLLLKDSARNRYAYLIFLNIGIATAYFDLLTYPITTFGIPMIVYLALSKDDALEEKLGGIVRNGLLWCFGYGAMWSSKWIIAGIVTGENVIRNAIDVFVTRTSTASADGLTHYSVFTCEIMNLTSFIKTPFVMLVIAFLFYLVMRRIRHCDLNRENTATVISPYLILALVPFVWFAFATNHSTIHYWFTNKACVMTLAAILFGMTDLARRIPSATQTAIRKERSTSFMISGKSH